MYGNVPHSICDMHFDIMKVGWISVRSLYNFSNRLVFFNLVKRLAL